MNKNSELEDRNRNYPKWHKKKRLEKNVEYQLTMRQF